MTLTIGWATPWNVNSAIGKMSADVTAALAGLGHQVEIISIEVGPAASLPTRVSALPVRPLATIGLDELDERFDVVFVNLGNHYPFHGGALDILRGVLNGVAILHDAWMGDFQWAWEHSRPEVVPASKIWVDCLPPDASLLGSLLSLCAGAVVHGQHYLEHAQRYCPGPVRRLPLAYTSRTLPGPPASTRFRIATVGHVNPNKRVDEVLKAIASSQLLHDRVDYFLLGPVADGERDRLGSLARALGIAQPIFTGWLEDDALFEEMNRMDAFCCLRFPVTEGGSASLVTAMLSGRPTLVSDHASYADVPDDAVLKCAPGREAAMVARHLERLILDPAEARRIGMRAVAYASETNSPRAYAVAVADFAEEVARRIPLIRTARSLGNQLGNMGVAPDGASVKRASSAMLGNIDDA